MSLKDSQIGTNDIAADIDQNMISIKPLENQNNIDDLNTLKKKKFIHKRVDSPSKDTLTPSQIIEKKILNVGKKLQRSQRNIDQKLAPLNISSRTTKSVQRLKPFNSPQLIMTQPEAPYHIEHNSYQNTRTNKDFPDYKKKRSLSNIEEIVGVQDK